MAHQKLAADLAAKQQALADAQTSLATISRNMALAKTEEQLNAMAAVFEQYQQQRAILEAEVAALKVSTAAQMDAKAEVAAAMALARRLTDMASDPENFAALSEVFKQVNARLFLRFTKVQKGKRSLNKLVSGVVTFGAAPPPITIYEGPTGRQKLNGSVTTLATKPDSHEPPSVPKPFGPGREGDSLGNVSRGDWI